MLFFFSIRPLLAPVCLYCALVYGLYDVTSILFMVEGFQQIYISFPVYH